MATLYSTIALVIVFFVLMYRYFVLQEGIKYVDYFVSVFFIFIMIPSFFIMLNRSNEKYIIDYSLSLLCICIIILCFYICIVTNKKKSAIPNTYSLNLSINREIFFFISVFFIVTGLLYIYFVITKSVNIFNLLLTDQTGGIVAARKIFWRITLKAVPFSSVFRFISKIGLQLLSLCAFSKKQYVIAFISMILSFFGFIVEGSKISIIYWGIPFLWYYVKKCSLKKKYLVSIISLCFIFSGTVMLALSEADNTTEAIKEKIIKRTFFVPSEVAIKHYEITGFNYLKGATIPQIAKIKGGYYKLIGDESLDYDNYIYKHIFYEKHGYLPVLGGANPPYYAYAWDDWGFVGVIIETVILLFLLSFFSKVLYGYSYIDGIVFFQIVLLATSTSVFNVFLGIENIFGIFVFNALLNNRKGLLNINIKPGPAVYFILGVGSYLVLSLI